LEARIRIRIRIRIRVVESGFSSRWCGSTTLLKARVADPHSFHPDPDPAFRLNTDPDTDPDPNRIQGFNDQKLKKKITAEKKIKFFWIKLHFTYP
jgi:hypothetical protein